jgi:hypothetical protein
LPKDRFPQAPHRLSIRIQRTLPFLLPRIFNFVLAKVRWLPNAQFVRSNLTVASIRTTRSSHKIVAEHFGFTSEHVVSAAKKHWLARGES